MLSRRTPLLAALVIVAACGGAAVTSTTTTVADTIDAGGLTSQIEELITAAEDIRGLDFVVDPVITVIDEDELADRIAVLIDQDLEPDDVAVYQRLFELLGLLDGTIDLRQAYIDLYAEQVGGYYDDDTGEMVIMGGSSLSPLSQSIVVHELVHALTDQHYGFADIGDDLWEAGEFEASMSVSALTEGDATYFQLLYLQTLTVDEQMEAVNESMGTDTTVMDSLPDWFGEDLTYPYDAGFRFVERLITDNDILALNQAYGLLPETSEQILHPDKYYLREGALPVTLPEIVVPGYSVFEESTFGEWNTRLYLLDGIDGGDALVAGAGWGGDRYRIYWQGSETCVDDCYGPVAFLYHYVGDSPRDAEELADAIARSAHAIMKVGSARTPVNGVTTYTGGEDFAWVKIDGEDVWFVLADDPAIGQAIVAGIGG